MAAGLRAARLSPALRGRRGLVLTFQCGPPARRGHLSRPRNPTRGAPETPYGWRGSAKERGYAHHSAWEASPALRWLPAAVYPETVGPAGAGPRRGQRSGRAQGGRLLGVARSRPPHAAARRTGAARDCPVPPRGREPGAAASASPGPAPRPGSAGAGARPSWAALWPAGWGPRPHPMGARCPCPLISPSAPPPPATCLWCSCGPPMLTKVRSVPGGWAEGSGPLAVPSTSQVCPLPSTVIPPPGAGGAQPCH